MKPIAKHFSELSADELYEIIKARISVFVVEQNCPYQELDGKDKAAYHLYFKDENGIAAYLRVLPQGISYKEASIGRVITISRGTGLGLKLLREGIAFAQKRFGADKIKIGAQLYARGFYEKAGFRQSGGEYLEDGIRHIEMMWEKTGE